MIPVGRLAPKDQWDQTLLDDLFSNRLFQTGLEFKRVEGYPNTEGCILVIPGRYWSAHTHEIEEALSRYQWVLGMRVGDEEDLFDISAVEHPNLKWWVQTPREGRDYGDARLFGVGYSPHFTQLPAAVKSLDVFLAAQRTNGRTGRHFRVYGRRDKFFKLLRRGAWSKQLIDRDGFAQGDRAEYVAYMLRAKVAPAPTGNVSPDSFRFYEALEAGAIPIADTVSEADGPTTYWQRLFGDDLPFPTVTDINDLPGIVDGLLADWPAQSERVQAWWRRQKETYARWLVDDLHSLGAL